MYHIYLQMMVVWLQMTLEEAIGYVASDELIEVSFCMQFIIIVQNMIHFPRFRMRILITT